MKDMSNGKRAFEGLEFTSRKWTYCLKFDLINPPHLHHNFAVEIRPALDAREVAEILEFMMVVLAQPHAADQHWNSLSPEAQRHVQRKPVSGIIVPK